jgi:hypothetical protein
VYLLQNQLHSNTYFAESLKIEESLNNLYKGYLNIIYKNGLATKESLQKEYSILYNLIREGKYNPSHVIPSIEYLDVIAKECRIRVAITIAARRIEVLEKILRRKIIKNKFEKQYFKDLAEEKFGCFTFANK